MTTSKPHCPLWSFFLAVLVTAFGLNWLWEMVQMPAYAEMAGRPWRDTLRPCTVAALGDVAITVAIVGVGTLAAGNLRWSVSGRWNVYTAAGLLGAACAVAVERNALASRRWSYTDAMPVVPGLNVGLWPLLQLSLLVPASWAVARWWCRPRRVAVSNSNG